jgi:leucyl/phenylalanyl-tRNA---protein transferase
MRSSEPLRLPWLDPATPDQPFPPLARALKEPNGLLALGGDLSPVRLLNAYRNGIFPWYSAGEPILWWSPDPRCVFSPTHIHVSRSLHKALKRKDYSVTLDTAFEAIIQACAEPRQGQRGTWLSAEMRTAYIRLHHLGFAHSVEVWRDGCLVGGLYGIALGGAFFGESMFSRARNGSKLALVWLARQLAAWGFTLLDGQVASPHLYSLGAMDISRQQFMQSLAEALAQPDRTAPWAFEIAVPGGK